MDEITAQIEILEAELKELQSRAAQQWALSSAASEAIQIVSDSIQTMRHREEEYTRRGNQYDKMIMTVHDVLKSLRQAQSLAPLGHNSNKDQYKG